MGTHSMKKGTNMKKEEILKAKAELVKKVESGVVLSQEDIEMAGLFGIKIPKETLPVKFARAVADKITMKDGKVVLPDLEKVVAEGKWDSTDAEMKKAAKFWGTVLPIIVAGVEAKMAPPKPTGK